MRNPWEEIDLKDYESHMSLESVYQLQVLNEMMREQFDSYDVKTVMVLGVAGGNGIEHIDTEKVDKVYGVDVNERFLAECRKRYTEYNDVFETICANLLSEDLQLPCAKFVIANLLIEYIGYECFQRVINQVKPQHISCIIQINTGDAFVSDSPYLHVFDGLDEVHHQMEKEALVNCMKAIGYKLKEAKERELPNGKKFVRMDFQEMTVEKVFDELTDKYGEDFNWHMISSFNGYFVEELKSEISEKHVLYDKDVQAIAKCDSNDDVLYVTKNENSREDYYLVHLTYSKQNEEGYPRYKMFTELEEVKAYIEQSFVGEYLV